MSDQFFIRDKGSQHGTFLKIVQPQPLLVGSLIELGSVLMEVERVNRDFNTIDFKLRHMGTKMESTLQVKLDN